MLVSIIVPMYNVSQYLEKCISHIQIKDVEYEILMINDGSPDNSLKIANQLSKNNHRIKVLSQENKGLGGARNLGIKNAKGKYILFLDADDILIKQEFSELQDEIVDIIEYSAKNISESNEILTEFNAEDYKCDSFFSGIKYFNSFPSMFSACNKLYLGSFLKDNDLFFKEQIYIEDFEFNTRTFFIAKYVKCSSEVIQHFVQVNNSITRNTNQKRKMKLVSDMTSIAVDILDFSKKYSLNEEQKKFVNYRLTYLSVDVVFHSLKNKLKHTFLVKELNRLKTNNCFVLNTKLKHSNKNRFRIFLNTPLSIMFIKAYLFFLSKSVN